MKRTKIALALAVAATALALPGSALPQALIIGTSGQPGDGKHTVAPVSAEQQNGDTSVSANAGAGNGSAATGSHAERRRRRERSRRLHRWSSRDG